MEEQPIGDPAVHPDLTPEGRRRAALDWRGQVRRQVGPDGHFWNSRLFRVLKRVGAGAWYDGSIHAGNLAYMAILALFPFFVTLAALLAALGEGGQADASAHAVLAALPPVVAGALEPVVRDVMAARSGMLLWIGAVVGLWTVTSLIETIRDILHRAYGTPRTRAFWWHRLLSTGLILGAMVMLLFSLFAQVAIVGAQAAMEAWFPRLEHFHFEFWVGQLLGAVMLYGSLFILFAALTPESYRGRAFPKWPGAMLVTIWWVGSVLSLPAMLRHIFAYDLTYGSLAGVMIALFFFWLVGLGVVAGAELNAALVESPEERDLPQERDKLGQADNRARKRDNQNRKADG